MNVKALDGLRILIVEDEFLIAMDVEQLCKDHGASDVRISGSTADLGPDEAVGIGFDAAIIDVMADGAPTFGFARELQARGVPFVFATGYSDREDLFAAFPGIRVVGKPFAGDELVKSLADAIQDRPAKATN